MVAAVFPVPVEAISVSGKAAGGAKRAVHGSAQSAGSPREGPTRRQQEAIGKQELRVLIRAGSGSESRR